MRFRQRLAWLLLFLYIGLTCLGAYYVFEFGDYYGRWASEHVRLYHTPDSTASSDDAWVVAGHATDFSFKTWLAVLSVPYTAMFAFLFVCTKPEPRAYLLKHTSALWNALLAFRCCLLHPSPQDTEDAAIPITFGSSCANELECEC